MSQFSDLNYYDLAHSLNFVTMSSYPTGHAESRSSLYLRSSSLPTFAYDVGDPYITGLGFALIRGFKPSHPFWVMEQQCGNVNWGVYNTGIRPGTVRLWTWHALTSGADAALYFRWRAGLFAQEQFHSGLLNHDASPAVGYNDLESMKAERSLMSEIASAIPEAKIAILLNYDSLWALRSQPHHRDFDYMRNIFVYYRALQRLGLPADIISTDADFSSYKLVIVPTAFVASEQLAHSLITFAEAGGVVLLGIRSGFKTTSNLVTDRPLPGIFREIVGSTVSSWQALPPGIGYDISSSIPGLTGKSLVWAEVLNPITLDTQSKNPDLQVLVHYSSGPFTSHAALVEHKVGTGQILYLGWLPDDSQAEALLAHLASKVGVPSLATIPERLIVSQRGPYVILLNFTDEPLTATVQGQMVSVRPRDVEVVKTHG
jgi:beta-galactosidase